MGLWKRVQRCLATGILSIAPFVTCAPVLRADSLEEKVVATSSSSEERNLPNPFQPYVPFLAGTAISLGALGAAHVVARLRKKRPSLLQPVAEHPFVTAAVTGVSYGLFWSIIGFGISHILSYAKPPYLLNLARFFWLGLREASEFDLERKYELISQMREACSPSLQPALDADLIDNLFLQEKVDDALDILKRLASNIGPEKNRQFIETMLVSPSGHQAVALLEGKKHPFSMMYGSLFLGKVEKAFKYLDGFVEQEPSTSRHAARAYVAQEVSDLWPKLREKLPSSVKTAPSSLDDYAQRYWNSAIASVLNDPQREQQFKLMGESRNEVLEYKLNQFLQGLLVFKRCDQKEGGRLRSERENILALRKEMDHVVQSLAYVEHEGKAYHVLRHLTNRTLENVLTENYDSEEKLGVWCQAARALARIHKNRVCRVDDGKLPDDHYSRRLVKVCYDQLVQCGRVKLPAGLREALNDLGLRVGRKLFGALRGFYKDSHWGNWLVENDGNVVAIDFENNFLQPVQLDLVSFLESGPLIAEKRATDYDGQGVVLEDVYLQPLVRAEYLAELGHIVVDRSEFLHQYEWAGLHRHLEFSGYRARDEEYDGVRFHIAQARDYAKRLDEEKVAGMLAQTEVKA